MKTRCILLFCLLLLCSAIVGCSFGTKKSADDGFISKVKSTPNTMTTETSSEVNTNPNDNTNKKKTVVKMLYSNEGQFDIDYGFYLKPRLPGIDIHIIPTDKAR